MTDPNARYRLFFIGECRYYNSLLPAMEQRKAILCTGTLPHFVRIEERTSDGWVWFDAEKFLDGLSVLFAV